MSIIQSIILGIVQGITEFLPVSSSGHLQLVKELLGVQIVDNVSFDVALHAGTVCSTLVVLWREVWGVLKGLFSTKYNSSQAFVVKILISMVPIGFVGFAFRDRLDELLASQYCILVVGGSLLFTSALLWFASRSSSEVEESKRSEIGYLDALWIGIAQAVAVLPGVSRSGATISSGLILGKRRGEIAQFSFLMVLAPIMGSMLLDVIKGGGELVVEGVSSAAMAAGFFASFVVGALACKAMIAIVRRGKLVYFAIYCAVVGAISVASYFL